MIHKTLWAKLQLTLRNIEENYKLKISTSAWVSANLLKRKKV